MKGFGYTVAFLAGAIYVWVMENIKPESLAVVILPLISISSILIFRRVVNEK